MAEKIKEGLNAILQSIENIVDSKVENSKYDKTYRGKIIAKTEDNIYTVQINGAEYNIRHNANLSVNDVVMVKAPLNNFSDIYIEGEQADLIADKIPVGSIQEFAGNEIPDMWLLCDGREISRQYYPELFGVIGITYGAGNGTTTFNLPDLRRRVSVGKDSNSNNFNVLGKTGGEETHTLTIDEMPSHNHLVGKSNVAFATPNPGNNSAQMYFDSNQGIPSTNTGGSQSHNNLQPYIVLNYIIKAISSVSIISKAEGEIIDNLNSTSPYDALSANQGKILNEKISTVPVKSIRLNGFKSDFYLVKNNKTVMFRYASDAVSLVVNDNGVVGRVPEGFAPIIDVLAANLPIGNARVQLTIKTDGTIYCYNYGNAITQDTTCRFNFCYITP